MLDKRTDHPETFPRPGNTVRELVTLLRGHGIDRLYWSACPARSVLSLPGVTVWCHAQTLTWHRDGSRCTWDADDVTGAAEHLASQSPSFT